MRVVICRDMVGESISMDVYADGLVKALRELYPEWEVLEAYPRSTGIKETSSILHGLRKYYEKFLRYPLKLRQHKADVYHVVDQSYAHLVYWLQDASVVVTCHDLINLRQPENLRQHARFPKLSMMAWHFSVKGLRLAHHVLAVSRYTAKEVKQMEGIDVERISVIPDGVNAIFHKVKQEDVIRSFRAKHGAFPEDICLLHVGGNAPRKNVALLIEVVRALSIKGIPAILWKTGADFTPQQKRLIGEYGLERKVIYLGQVTDDALVWAYNAADIVVIPSLYEGFGMPVLEAMACGTPVITSNTSSLPEVAGDAARLVSPHSVEEIVDEVLLVMGDPILRRQLVDKGLARAKMYSWKVVASKVAEIYEQIIAGQSYAHPDGT